jgi:hypothetical protein
VRQTFQRLLVETYHYLDDCFGLGDKYGLDVTYFTGLLPD